MVQRRNRTPQSVIAGTLAAASRQCASLGNVIPLAPGTGNLEPMSWAWLNSPVRAPSWLHRDASHDLGGDHLADCTPGMQLWSD